MPQEVLVQQLSGSGIPETISRTTPLSVNVSAPVTAFGELWVAEVTPIVQQLAVYGFSADKEETFTSGTGTATIKDLQFNASAGTTATSIGSVFSRRNLTYKAGQGIVSRFTAVFENPLLGANLSAGLISPTDRLAFGYNDSAEFGIHYDHNGIVEIQTLTVTTAATGSEDATVTVDGTGFTVALTSGTEAHNAFEISESLNPQVERYDFSSNGDTVVARALSSVPAGSFAFSSATAEGAWVQDVEGALVDASDFITQANWNGGANLTGFDPELGNVYQISMQYLGYGAIRFCREDPTTGMFETVHTIEYANSNTIPSVANPSFRLGVLAVNTDGTASEPEVRTSSFFGGIEGKNLQTEPSRAYDLEGTVTNTLRSVLTVRNRIVFGDLANRVEMKPLFLSVGTDSTKSILVDISVAAVHTGDLDFAYVDEADSVIEVAEDQNVVANGRLIQSFIVGAGGSEIFNMTDLATRLLPTEIMTISAVTTSGGGSSAIVVSFVWQEDL